MLNIKSKQIKKERKCSLSRSKARVARGWPTFEKWKNPTANLTVAPRRQFQIFSMVSYEVVMIQPESVQQLLQWSMGIISNKSKGRLRMFPLRSWILLTPLWTADPSYSAPHAQCTTGQWSCLLIFPLSEQHYFVMNLNQTSWFLQVY